MSDPILTPLEAVNLAILQTLAGPKAASGDAGSVESHSLKDLLELQKFLSAGGGRGEDDEQPGAEVQSLHAGRDHRGELWGAIPVEIDGVRVIHGDCLDVLPTLVGIDAVVTDPPYGMGYVRGAGGRGAQGQRDENWRPGSEPIAGDDRPFDPTPFLGWPCVFFGANHFAQRLPADGSWHVWDKRSYSTIDDSFADIEFIWASVKVKSEVIEHLWKGVQRASEVGGSRDHVSQKPVRVMRHLIEKYTRPGDVVLDPYAGSGTTGVACLKSGRKCILIEKDERYIPIIHRRLRDASTPLFAGMGA